MEFCLGGTLEGTADSAGRKSAIWGGKRGEGKKSTLLSFPPLPASISIYSSAFLIPFQN